MKLTTLLLIIALLQASAKEAYSQITLNAKHAPLASVLQSIKQQTGYVFFSKDIDLNKPLVDIKVNNVTIDQALTICFKDISLEYKIEDKTVFIKEKSPPPINKLENDVSLSANPINIAGNVKNKVGEPLVGASIIVTRTKGGTLTDAKGNFNLKSVYPDDIITVSYIGFKSISFKISDPHDGATFNLIMQVADNSLDQVIIQTYGTTSQRYATGDVTTIKAEEIEKQPVMNPLLALQGRVAGLDIQQTSGYASGPIIAQIRGRSNLDGTLSNPLYIVDGVPLFVLPVGAAQGGAGSGFLQNSGLNGPANGQSPLFSINPADIESISVLKDADATSIYGSRGANGVILINTKKGKAGKTSLDIHVDEGINQVDRFWKLLNTPQYLEMRREAFKNDGIIPNVSNAPDLLVWNTNSYTDWQKALYGKAGKIVNAQMSVTGGDAFTSFRIAGSYTNSAEITTASGADQRASLLFNLTHASTNRRMNISFTADYSLTQSDMITLPGSITYAPDAPPIYDSSGKLDWKDWESSIGNPFSTLLQPYTATTNYLNSNFNINYILFKGLSISTTLGYNHAQANQTQLTPIASQDPITEPTGSSQFGNNSNTNWIIEPQLSYETLIGKGKLSAILGGSAQETTTDGIYLLGTGYTSDALLRTISNAPNSSSTDNYGEYRYASVFARTNYNFDGKYILNLSARRDGSSNYGPGKQYGDFASVGAAWIFTEEGWFKDHPSFLSFGKLRGSYGTTGSDGGKPYAYITRWVSSGQTYDGIIPLAPTQHANPNYQWQQNNKLELATDLGFFKDWVTLSVAYYRDRTDNQLLPYPTPLLSGFPNVLANLDALVQNAGWEFTVGGKGFHVTSKYFNWGWAPNFTFSINQNRFIAFNGLGSSPFRNGGLIGKTLDGRYILHYTGVDPQTGQYTYQDINHDGYINSNYGPAGDVYFKKTAPSYSTGFGFNFDLQGFTLSLFFIAKKQTGYNAIAQGANPGAFNHNQPIEVLARWQKPGDISNVGKFSTIGAQDPTSNLSNSDIGFTDASYIRLQNLSLSYKLPESLTKKSGVQCSAFMHASNLFTITGYKGIDPDIQNFGGLPPAKTVVFGLSFNY